MQEKGMSGTGSLLDAVQLADTLGTAGVRSPQARSSQATDFTQVVGPSCIVELE